MTVYIAAPFKRKREAQEVAAQLAELGVKATSRWHSTHPSTDDPAELAIQAKEDLDDVDQADVFMLLNYKGWVMEGQGGKHVETGYALARGKRVVLVGKRWNVFHYLPQVEVVTDPAHILQQRTGDEVV